ncbi:malonyl CoA-acyl carrier protein transacylase [Clostridia bacterium]|nr:malonyl CoA-acyl carrier protein transacylase [Clostridia bacterium]
MGTNNNNSWLAVVFAGQGAQKPGMGFDLYESSVAARTVFDRAGDEIKHDCFESDAEHLKQTEVTQPAVYTMDMACLAALKEATADTLLWQPEMAVATTTTTTTTTAAASAGGREGFHPTNDICCAGFSLGEYAALTAAGVIGSFEEGLALVRKRSLLMKAAGTNSDGSPRGAMAAGMGTAEAVLALVEQTRGSDILEAVNFNSPGQTVVAGDIVAVERFVAAAKENRSLGVKAIPLPVSGAFHSPIMASAAEGLAAVLSAHTFSAPHHRVYLNVTGEDIEAFRRSVTKALPVSTSGIDTISYDAAWKEVMIRQMQSPVQWQRTVEQMEADGVRVLIEVGPGKTLSGLVKKITSAIEVCHVEDAESLAAAAEFVKENSL